MCCDDISDEVTRIINESNKPLSLDELIKEVIKGETE
jgi:hypothetical protein